MDKTVADYYKKQKSPQKEMCEKLRQLIFKTFPDINEEMKWGVPSYDNGNYYIVALKDHVNLGFSMKGLSKEELDYLEGSGKTMRHISVSSVEEIEEEKVVFLLKLIKSKNL